MSKYDMKKLLQLEDVAGLISGGSVPAMTVLRQQIDETDFDVVSIVDMAIESANIRKALSDKLVEMKEKYKEDSS